MLMNVVNDMGAGYAMLTPSLANPAEVSNIKTLAIGRTLSWQSGHLAQYS